MVRILGFDVMRRRSDLKLQRINRDARQRKREHQSRVIVKTPKEAVRLAAQDPYALRAIERHSMDLTRLGFTLCDPETGEPVEEDQELQAWFEELGFYEVTPQGIKDSHITGDGFVEFLYDDDAPNGMTPAEGEPVGLRLIDPTEIDLQQEGRDIILRQRNAVGNVELHESRWHQFRVHEITGDLHGVSSIVLASRAILAKVKADRGGGEALYKTGLPFRVATIANTRGANDESISTVQEILADPEASNVIVWTDDLEVEQLNPTNIDPTPWVNGWIESICVSVGVPTPLVRGVQAGAVTGSEVNLHDYHEQLHAQQCTIIEPLVRRLVASRYPDLEYVVKWAEFPMPDAARAELMMAKSRSYEVLVRNGFTREAAARLAGLDFMEDDFGTPQGTPDAAGFLRYEA